VILGICPTVDYAFKRLLGSPEYAEITVHFINAVLAGSPRIAEVEMVNPILDKDRSADKLAILELADRLPSPIFRQAAGVLQMISQTPRERDLYEARLKLERDEAARLQGAREEGERIGKLMGTIQTLQQLLQVNVSPPEELRGQSEAGLTRLMESLQARLRERGLA